MSRPDNGHRNNDGGGGGGGGDDDDNNEDDGEDDDDDDAIAICHCHRLCTQRIPPCPTNTRI